MQPGARCSRSTATRIKAGISSVICRLVLRIVVVPDSVIEQVDETSRQHHTYHHTEARREKVSGQILHTHPALPLRESAFVLLSSVLNMPAVGQHSLFRESHSPAAKLLHMARATLLYDATRRGTNAPSMPTSQMAKVMSSSTMADIHLSRPANPPVSLCNGGVSLLIESQAFFQH